ncbi:MAG TPA: IS1634 family transposase [Candidatus Eremiobacteraeota bacterium]|nr:IS1634 family transposase [Candidatus Eremiobacteraeota bacterium]
MYIREVTGKRKYGASVKYLQLVENNWNKEKKRPETNLICNFGRIDQLNAEEMKSIAYKILSYLEEKGEYSPDLVIGESKEYGLLYLLEQSWKKLRLDKFFRKELKKHKYEAPIEKGIIGMLFNRLQEPASKLGSYEWLQEETHYPVSNKCSLHHLYRALDFLELHHEELEEDLYFTLCNLFNREVDLLFFDTRSTYFEVRETEEEDIRQYGHPHGHRRDGPQILIGLAVNSEGIPLLSEVFPGNTADVSTVKKIISRTKRLGLREIIFVSDLGTVSEENLKELKEVDIDYIVGVKLRSTKEVREEVLPSAGEFSVVSDNLQVKEVTVQGHRYIICYNPKEARKDRHTRDRWVSELELLLPSVNTGKKDPSVIKSHPVMKRLCHKNDQGRWVINEEKLKQEELCDDIYILGTSKISLPSEKVAIGYKTLQRIEKAFHYIKSFIELRPCYHWRDLRIKGHVLLCVIAYLIQRWIELQTEHSWPDIKVAFKKIHAVDMQVKKQKFIHRSQLNPISTEILNRLKIKYPSKIINTA